MYLLGYLDRYIDRCIGKVSLHYWWSIGEVSVNANYIDRCECRSIDRSILNWYINRASTATRSILDRYLVECRSRYWSIYRPIHRSRIHDPTIAYFIKWGNFMKNINLQFFHTYILRLQVTYTYLFWIYLGHVCCVMCVGGCVVTQSIYCVIT